MISLSGRNTNIIWTWEEHEYEFTTNYLNNERTNQPVN
jgi:hypothetical protein